MKFFNYCFVTAFQIVLIQGKDCGTPGRPTNGWFAIPAESYPPGSVVDYYCVNESMLFGPKQRRCRIDGTWTGDIPVCELPIVLESVKQSTTLRSNSADKAIDKIMSTCSATASVDPKPSWEATLQEEGIVRGIRITLLPESDEDFEVFVETKDEQQVQHCDRFAGSVGLNVTKEIMCPESITSKYILIRSNKGKDNIFQLCEVEVFVKGDVGCLSPDIPDHGRTNAVYSGTTTSYTFFCNTGFFLQGNSKTYCNPNGTWSLPSPSCEEVTCSVPPGIPNGKVQVYVRNGVVPYGEWANYSCIPGFELVGSDSRTCKDLDEWSTEEPQCISIRCEKPAGIFNGTYELLDKSISYGSRLRIICKHGFRTISGSEDVVYVCQANGKWGDYTENVCREMEEPKMGKWERNTSCNDANSRVLSILAGAAVAIIIIIIFVIALLIRKRWAQRKHKQENSSSVFGSVVFANTSTGRTKGRCLLASCSSASQDSPTERRAHAFTNGGNTSLGREPIDFDTLRTDVSSHKGRMELNMPVYSLPYGAIDNAYEEPPLGYGTTKSNRSEGDASHIYAEPVESPDYQNWKEYCSRRTLEGAVKEAGMSQDSAPWTRPPDYQQECSSPTNRKNCELMSSSPISHGTLRHHEATNVAPSLPPRRNLDLRKTLPYLSSDASTSENFMRTSSPHFIMDSEVYSKSPGLSTSTGTTTKKQKPNLTISLPPSEHEEAVRTPRTGQLIGMVYNDVYFGDE